MTETTHTPLRGGRGEPVRRAAVCLGSGVVARDDKPAKPNSAGRTHRPIPIPSCDVVFVQAAGGFLSSWDKPVRLVQKESGPLVAAADEGRGLATPETLPCPVACFLSDWLLRRYQIGSARQMRPLHFEFHWSYLP